MGTEADDIATDTMTVIGQPLGAATGRTDSESMRSATVALSAHASVREAIEDHAWRLSDAVLEYSLHLI